MIPSDEFDEFDQIILHKSQSDTQNTIKQILQNVNNKLTYPHEQQKSPDLKINLCKDDVNESDIQLKFYEAPVLKKQQSDTSYDQKKNQLTSFAKNQLKDRNSRQKIDIFPTLQHQQNQQPILEVQSKGQNDDEISIVKFDDTNEELHDILFQLQEAEKKVQERKGQFINFLEGNQQIKEDQLQSSVDTQFKQQFQIEIQQNIKSICLICASDQQNSIQLLGCSHKFCLNCYKEYLSDKIKNAKIINIPCPQDGCSEIFPESIIQKTVKPSVFENYLNFKFRLEIENDVNKKWCPAPGCNYYVERNTKTNIVLCKCGVFICFNCGQLAHQNIQCQQAIEQDFRTALNKFSIKSCPKCKSHVEKNAGCNHMTCRCGYQYCWVCLQQYYEYHYRYWSLKGCAIWSNGRFKTRKIIKYPNLMRRIFFLPRLILFILRGPLIFLKLLFKAFRKSISKPYSKLNKKLYRQRKPRKCVLKVMYFLLIQLLILIIMVIIVPFYFLFYRIFKEFRWLRIKGCAY